MIKILFVPHHRIPATAYQLEFLVNFLEHLSKKQHQIGVLTNKPVSMGNGNRERIAELNSRDVNYSHWDVILVQDVVSLKLVNAKVKDTPIPIIFLSHDTSWDSQPFLCDNLIQVYQLYLSERYDELPSEIVRHFRKPVFTRLSNVNSQNDMPRMEQKCEKIKAIHWHQQQHDNNLTVVKTVIACANWMLNVDMYIVAKKEVNYILKTIVNPNIKLVDVDEFSEDLLEELNVAVTSDYYAVKMLYLGIPTIVVGNRGFGGLILGENIDDHLNLHFDGRIGGEINEGTPIWLLKEELTKVGDEYAMIKRETDAIASLIRETFSAKAVFSDIEEDIITALKTRTATRSRDYLFLKPKIFSGIKTISSPDGDVYIVGDHNHIVGMISNVESTIFLQCDGKKNIFEIAAAVELDTDNVGEFIRQLWEQKIMAFE